MAKFGLWRPGSDLRAWLFTIMHNLYLNQLRGRPPSVSIDDLDLGSMAPTTAGPDSTFGDLVKCLAQLSPEHREVLLLVGLEDMSYQEVSKVLGIPIGTVMSRLSRGRERLSALMSGEAVVSTSQAGLRVVK
jgi:RNA polymerase sigma-70 factor (ECF subfamily)